MPGSAERKSMQSRLKSLERITNGCGQALRRPLLYLSRAAEEVAALGVPEDDYEHSDLDARELCQGCDEAIWIL